MRRVSRLGLVALIIAVALMALPAAAATPGGIGNASFLKVWSRTDRPVLELGVDRSWMWGPIPNTIPFHETYLDSPGGERIVQYFDKSRMEINHPDADMDETWYVTNGLLAKELITGEMQVGDDDYVPGTPAEVNIAGDQDDPNSPTYASFTGLQDYLPIPTGWTIIQTVDRNGNVGASLSLAAYGVTAGYLAPETNHNIASVFWAFMNQSGTIYEDGDFTTDRLLEDPFFAVGLPLTEAYWTKVDVAGVERDVLVQAFERRVMTYTPSNPEGWRVEAGNVGQHYFTWRYGDAQPATEQVKMHLIALNDNGQSGMEIGCEDSVIPVTIDIEAGLSTEGKIEAALNRMFGIGEEFYGESGLFNVFYNSSLAVDNVSISGDTATVDLKGTLSLGGVCDDPRVEAQIEQTVVQFAGVNNVVVELNGQPLIP